MKRRILCAAGMLWLCFWVFAEEAGGSSKPRVVDTESTTPAGGTASAAESEKRKTEDSAKIEEALKTPPDAYGIPTGIYTFDKTLSGYRNAVESSKTRRWVWAGVGLACIGGGILLGKLAPELVWAPYNVPTSVPWGYAIAGLGGGLIAFDLIVVVPSVPRHVKQLQSAYQEKYAGQ